MPEVTINNCRKEIDRIENLQREAFDMAPRATFLGWIDLEQDWEPVPPCTAPHLPYEPQGAD